MVVVDQLWRLMTALERQNSPRQNIKGKAGAGEWLHLKFKTASLIVVFPGPRPRTRNLFFVRTCLTNCSP